ncbi:hypothetical protein [Vibrio sp. D431a]|uniref:hypothetical protein n=1 Tax=Vibrio sp. D431a TaxID=2837388 RepID=UPI0025567375|nr:hypothetical protein [Vibrio sp. D431a]MDK9793871.1 hypothetical protein [Vibrio sp. D431a]
MYSYLPRENEHFELVLESMKLDSSLLDVPIYSPNIINGTLNALHKKIQDEETTKSASLAIIGLMDFFIQKQVSVSDNMLTLFEKACSIDPYKHVNERKGIIDSLKAQLASYLDDNI